MTPRPAVATAPDRAQVLDTMRRATIFMVEKVATQGGFVWSYLPDMSRRWGEIEARPTMIWMQPPGTPTMGHLFLDAHHATGGEYYYRAAEQVAGALMLAQHPAGGWNYLFDTAGEAPRRQWYNTVGRNAWRLEEFQHDWGNATFDDGGTSQSTEFLLRLFLEKHDSKYKAALDRAIQFVLDSQDPVGAWPQRFPLKHEFSHHAKPDYTSFLTFNDEVTAGNVEHLLRFYRLTGDAKFLARIPEALDWLDGVKLPPDIAAIAGGGRTHPTFVELGTNKNLYVHRRGSNVVIGEYYVDGDPHDTIGHYNSFRQVDVAQLRKDYLAAKALPTAEASKGSPLRPSAGRIPLPRYFAVREPSVFGPVATAAPAERVARVVGSLDGQGRWLAPLGSISHPYRGAGSKEFAPGDFSRTQVGDESDTSPYLADPGIVGISTSTYIRNMSELIRVLDGRR